MKRLMIGLTLLLLGQICFAKKPTGLLFNVVLDANTLTFTPKTDYLYPEVGMRITSPGFSFSTPKTQCTNWPHTKGYCQFVASRKTPGSVSITGSGKEIKFKLCLNFWGKLTCQNYRINIGQNNCPAVGKTVSGSNACWIQSFVTDLNQPLRCSDVCAAVGLVLQDPGPVNSQELAANVCSAFGFTDPPQYGAPDDITYIAIGTRVESTACLWYDTEGTNWNNPQNMNFTGFDSGSYICPCSNS